MSTGTICAFHSTCASSSSCLGKTSCFCLCACILRCYGYLESRTENSTLHSAIHRRVIDNLAQYSPRCPVSPTDPRNTYNHPNQPPRLLDLLASASECHVAFNIPGRERHSTAGKMRNDSTVPPFTNSTNALTYYSCRLEISASESNLVIHQTTASPISCLLVLQTRSTITNLISFGGRS